MIRFFITYLRFAMRRRWHQTVGYKSDIETVREALQLRNLLLEAIVRYSNIIKALDAEMDDLAFDRGKS